MIGISPRKSWMLMIVAALLLMSCEQEPTANFSASKTDVLTGEEIQFTNQSTDGYEFNWSFGDGGVSTQASPMYSYEEAGTYTVLLTAFSESGKYANTTSKTIQVEYANEIRFTGQKYPLTQAFIINYGDWDGSGVFNFDVVFLSDGIYFTEDSVSGTGEIVVYEMWTNTPTALAAGNYIFSTAELAGTITSGFMGINLNIYESEGPSFEAASAIATVAYSGSDLKLSGQMIMDNAQEAKVYYTGPYTSFDFSNQKVHSKPYKPYQNH